MLETTGVGKRAEFNPGSIIDASLVYSTTIHLNTTIYVDLYIAKVFFPI